MENKIIGYVAPEQDAYLIDSATVVVAAGGDVISTNSIIPVGVAGRDLHIKDGLGGLIITGNMSHIENSKIGILLGKRGVNLHDSNVLITGPMVAVVGIIAGFVCVFFVSVIKLLRKMF